MNKSNALLGNIVSARSYAKFLQHLSRRESLEETINRKMIMDLDRFGSLSKSLSKDIIKAYGMVHDLKIMPSMRGMQFAGEAILKNNIRQYNCSYLPIDNVRCFGEALFLLLSGVGVGFSVQKRHVSQLPKVQVPKEEGRFIVHDSIEGWAQSVDALFEAYFFRRVKPVFDFTSVRPKGSYLVTTGAKAPGPDALKSMLSIVEQILKNSADKKLTPIQVHDIVCLISDCVLAGGIRRAALISLFDKDDTEMLESKKGDWWVKNPQRARANNSAVLIREGVTKEEFYYIFKQCQESGSGEPGFSWTNNPDWGFNPCVTGDTTLFTKKGYKRIDSLIDEEVEIWNGFEWSKVTPKITGKDQQILKVKFSDGRELKCTPYHKFHLSKGYHGQEEVVEAKDLKLGDKLIKHDFPIIESGKECDLDEMYTQGFYSADGVKNTDIIWLYEPKYELEQYLKCERLGKEYNNQFGTGRYQLKLLFENKPKEYIPFESDLKGRLAWIAGLLDGDGCELKEGGFQLTSVDYDFLINFQNLLSTLGVNSKIVFGNKEEYRRLPNGKGGYDNYYCQESNRICVGASQVQDLIKLGLNCKRLKFEKLPNRDASRFVQVVGIEELGIEDYVYCFNEPKRHLGIFNGVITGQCHEISLNPNQFCNLTTINQTGVTSKKEFLSRIYSATLIGTLQAAYTDFPYIRPRWQNITEKEALLGVSFTGIADSNGVVTADWLKEGAKLALEVNEKYAKKIGTNPAARVTTIKPEGSASCVVGSSSGIHARHSEYYLRRIRMNKDDALAGYLQSIIPDLVEPDKFSSTGLVVTIPQQSPSNALIKDNETALSLFKRALMYNRNWVAPGHRYGDNKHNVSCTVSVRDEEWDSLKEEMWKYRDIYSGVSLLPFDGGTYEQAPFESCTKEVYEEYEKMVKDIDLKNVIETEDNTNRLEQIACGGGSCEIV